jgi:hypothetical protein
MLIDESYNTFKHNRGASKMDYLSTEMQNCIQECTRCHQTCLATITHCLNLGGKHADPDHITLLADCAEICQTSADFMSRNSHHHELTCDICSELCVRCAESCMRMREDPEMQACAEACLRCAESCRRMAQPIH